MGAKSKFKIRDRIKPSEHGIRKGIFPREKNRNRGGTVKGFSRDDKCVRVQWDGTKGQTSYWHGYLDVIGEKKL